MNPSNELIWTATDEIQVLVSRFADACMRQDAAAFGELWTADAEWIIGEPFPLSERGRDNVVSAFVKLLGQWEFFAQFPHSLLVEVDGPLATAQCSVEELGQNLKTKASYHNIAYYYDDLRLEEGVWRFHRRDYRYLWLGDGIHGRPIPVEFKKVYDRRQPAEAARGSTVQTER
jgi:ketosteroid isomerase-like protein